MDIIAPADRRPSRRLRMAVRVALGVAPVPVHDIPLFILPSPASAPTPYAMPFWSVRGDVAKWWGAMTDSVTPGKTTITTSGGTFHA